MEAHRTPHDAAAPRRLQGAGDGPAVTGAGDRPTSPILVWQWLDKSTWGPGPWQEEPDKVQWQDPQTGSVCLAVRGPMGGWCG